MLSPTIPLPRYVEGDSVGVHVGCGGVVREVGYAGALVGARCDDCGRYVEPWSADVARYADDLCPVCWQRLSHDTPYDPDAGRCRACVEGGR